MAVETYLGWQMLDIYSQIQQRYPSGVNYLSTKQISDENKIRYSISFEPLEPLEQPINEQSDSDILELLQQPQDDLQNENLLAVEKNREHFLNTLQELEKELARLEEMVDVSQNKELQDNDDESATEGKEPKGLSKTAQDNIMHVSYPIIDGLVKKGLSREWIDGVLTQETREEIGNDKGMIINYLLDEVEASLKFTKLNSSKIVMTAGPTGVGKTTSIAKIAYSLKEKKPQIKIAFINLDHNRVAASEQIKRYASMLDMKYADVQSTEEFNRYLDLYQDNDLTFIDTGGISPYDISKLLETVSFISKADKFEIKTTLVLSATLKKEDMHSMFESFSFLSPDTLIVTKFDETSTVTELVDFLLHCHIPISYFSAGQSISDSLVEANIEFIRTRLAKEWSTLSG